MSAPAPVSDMFPVEIMRCLAKPSLLCQLGLIIKLEFILKLDGVLSLTPFKIHQHREGFKKVDRVGPGDNRPSTDKLHHFVQKKRKEKKKKKKCDMWHMTHDMWHVTCDMWHVTRDTWHMTHDTWHVTCDMQHVTCDMLRGGGTFSQSFSSLALLVCDLWYFED